VVGCVYVWTVVTTDTRQLGWTKIPKSKGGLGYTRIPLVADTTKEIAARYGVLHEGAGIAFRGLFLIGE
jgi:alkyl hydroperoxide reductase subunit AhpC